MTAQERRAAIWEALVQAAGPLSASALAGRFGVSRQLVVGDIALLRASGADITATARGYVVRRDGPGVVRQVACCHDAGGMERELLIMVDQGCTVLDVIVEHPVYGQLTGGLHLSSRYDVAQFIRRSADAPPLCLLTEGVHLHTLSCPDGNAFQRVERELAEAGILLETEGRLF